MKTLLSIALLATTLTSCVRDTRDSISQEEAIYNKTEYTMRNDSIVIDKEDPTLIYRRDTALSGKIRYYLCK